MKEKEKPDVDKIIASRFVQMGDVVLDAGSYEGRSTLLFLTFGAKTVYAVEPVATSLDVIRAKKEKKVIPVGKALGLYDGTQPMIFSPAVESRHTLKRELISLFPAVYEPDGRPPARRSVDVVTIDTLLAGKRIDYVNLDIEGSECDALRGAVQTYLRAKRPRVTVCSLYPAFRAEGLMLLRKYHTKVCRAEPRLDGSLFLSDPATVPGWNSGIIRYVGWNE